MNEEIITITSLVIGGVGAVTGIISLVWHILNSRSKVILERICFTKADRHTHKVTIDVKATIRNKGNRATTIEDVDFEFGNMFIEIKGLTPIKVEPNSSHKLEFSRSISLEEFKELLEKGKIKLGIEIIHTFGRIEKHGYTNFSTPWLNVV